MRIRQLINLTPHTIYVWSHGEIVLSIPTSDGEARAGGFEDYWDDLYVESSGDKIPLYSWGFGEVTGLPAERPEVGYIVSRNVAEQIAKQSPGRSDLFVPGHTVRNAEGVIIGCKCLMRI